MKKYQIKINNMKLEIIQDDDGKFITPYLCIEDWGKFGTALKPSFEPIIVARKPFKGSLVDNVIENGVGGINIDECRVGNEVIKGGTMPKMNSQSDGINLYNFGKHNAERLERPDSTGRFPANTILTYDEEDFDEVCGGFPYTNSGKIKLNSEVKRKGITEDMPVFNSKNCGIDVNKATGLCSFGDSGSASRYFYCAKASAKDRNEGLDIEIEEYHLKDDTPEEIKNKILNSLTS
jgi:site-specific DNA-methyltransferase (adenine-specific)